MLKRDPHDCTLFFDLEWVPDAAGARRVLDLAENVSEREAIGQLWKLTDPTGQNPRPFVKYLFSRIVSIAFLSRKLVFRDGVREPEFKIHSLPRLPLDDRATDEAYLIERFLYYIGERGPHLVGFNSLESDLQVLIQRALVHEVSAPGFCLRPSKPWEGRDYFHRYSEEHLDLLKLFSNGAMAPRLNELARICGFPGKLDVEGNQVVDLWLEGRLDKIIEYNQIDCLNTYLIWLRVVHFCGKLTDEEYQTEQFLFRDFLAEEASSPEKHHIRRFLNKWEL